MMRLVCRAFEEAFGAEGQLTEFLPFLGTNNTVYLLLFARAEGGPTTQECLRVTGNCTPVARVSHSKLPLKDPTT